MLIAILPRAMPWARSFWAFSPFLDHFRNFSKLFEIPLSPSFSSFFFVFFLLLVLLCFPSFSTLLIICEFAPNRPAARKFANYEAFKIPPFCPCASLCASFLALYSSALFCSVFPCRLLGQIPASFPASFPCSQLSTFLR